MDDVKYWPFEVLPPDKRTEHHQQVIGFMEQAFLEGYRPYVFRGSNYGACTPNGRIGEMIHRGANRYWEVLFRTTDERTGSFYVDGFTGAGEAVLHWLRGEDPSAIVTQFKDHIVPKPGVYGW
jgi:hypothetical protein